MRTDEAKGKMQEMISSEGAVEGCEQDGFLIKNDQPVSMAGIQLCEVVRVCKFMGNFLHSGHLVVIVANGLIEVKGS